MAERDPERREESAHDGRLAHMRFLVAALFGMTHLLSWINERVTAEGLSH